MRLENLQCGGTQKRDCHYFQATVHRAKAVVPVGYSRRRPRLYRAGPNHHRDQDRPEKGHYFQSLRLSNRTRDAV